MVNGGLYSQLAIDTFLIEEIALSNTELVIMINRFNRFLMYKTYHKSLDEKGYIDIIEEFIDTQKKL